MYLTEIILRLRATAPVFQRRVSGAAAFEKALAPGSDIALPHAFVVPAGEKAAPAQGNAIAQGITETFMVVVAVDNSGNPAAGRGAKAAMDDLEVIKRQLFRSFLGWEPIQWKTPAGPTITPGFEDLLPNSRLDTIRYVSAEHIEMTTSKLWHCFEFSCFYYDAPDLPDQVKTFTSQVMAGGDVTIPLPPGGENVEIVSVFGPSGQWFDYTWNDETGVLHPNNGPPGTYTVWYVYQLPNYFIQRIYAEYYPTLLAQAGGDPDAITPEMYALISEVHPDDVVVGVTLDDPVPEDPIHVFGKHFYIEED